MNLLCLPLEILTKICLHDPKVWASMLYVCREIGTIGWRKVAKKKFSSCAPHNTGLMCESEIVKYTLCGRLHRENGPAQIEKIYDSFGHVFGETGKERSCFFVCAPLWGDDSFARPLAECVRAPNFLVDLVKNIEELSAKLRPLFDCSTMTNKVVMNRWCINGFSCRENNLPATAIVRVDIGAPGAKTRFRFEINWTRGNLRDVLLVKASYVTAKTKQDPTSVRYWTKYNIAAGDNRRWWRNTQPLNQFAY